MGELRQSKTGSLEDQNVLERVGEVVLTTNDVINLQLGIIRAGRQVIGRHPVATQKREVLDIGGGFGLLAVNAINKTNLLHGFSGHPEAQSKRLSGGGPAVALGAGKIGRASCRERVSSG